MVHFVARLLKSNKNLLQNIEVFKANDANLNYISHFVNKKYFKQTFDRERKNLNILKKIFYKTFHQTKE